MTMNTDNLRPGELLHMDFCFLDETSIRQFTCALARGSRGKSTKNVDILHSRQTTPPLAIVEFLLEQLKQMDRQVINIRTDLGGELARSSEFYDLLFKDYQCGLQTIDGYFP